MRVVKTNFLDYNEEEEISQCLYQNRIDYGIDM